MGNLSATKIALTIALEHIAKQPFTITTPNPQTAIRSSLSQENFEYLAIRGFDKFK